MNYSAVALVLVCAYLWYANSLQNEIGIIKKLLVVIYESVDAKFNVLMQDIHRYHETVLQSISRLHNMTKHSVDLILVNSKKIDIINGKIDKILEK
ncbi:GP16 [Alphabaculovirus myunipunctae]|uniref:GP16 n=1 Tax=Mythimna unipuncta nucleopolyhedrovirus TaxID=447897 RepID=A0A2K9VS41_9ABAC|nr:GP16 [Mythimna unipuncta nucleopolyhedrovirus]AUV65272.1 GP16 [Mythimna unipuncta nucleopolyhedrovirus]